MEKNPNQLGDQGMRRMKLIDYSIPSKSQTSTRTVAPLALSVLLRIDPCMI